MSSEIIKSININAKNKKVFITSYSSNVCPKIATRWHCKYYDNFFENGGIEAIQKDILFSFFSGCNKGLSTNYGKAMLTFKHDGNYHDIFNKCKDKEFKETFQNQLLKHFKEFEKKRKCKKLFNIKFGDSWLYYLKRGGGGAATCGSQYNAKKFNLATAETILQRFAHHGAQLVEIQ